MLDARGAISVSQRAGMILSIRKLACAVAAAYVAETVPAEAGGGRPWLSPPSSCWRSASRRCRRPGCPALTAQLRERFLEAAERERLEPAEVQAFSTPRRLVLARPRAGAQDDREESVWGPALKAAKDAAGRGRAPPRASPEKNGVAPEALGVGAKDPAKPDELYLLFVKKAAGPRLGRGARLRSWLRSCAAWPSRSA